MIAFFTKRVEKLLSDMQSWLYSSYSYWRNKNSGRVYAMALVSCEFDENVHTADSETEEKYQNLNNSWLWYLH